jgi:NADH-quinone oxidoreductase subunit L
MQKFFFQGWDFDLLYDKVIVQPIIFFSRIDKEDIIDQFYTGLAAIAGLFNKGLAATQNGKLRWYAMALAIGTVITLTILLYT